MTYSEYLQSQGASAEDIKVLDTPLARRIFDDSQAKIAAATAEAQAAKDGAKAYETRVNQWFEDHDKEFKTVEAKLITESSLRAKAETALRTAHERGMIEDLKAIGYDPATPPTTPPATPPNGAPSVDTSKFVTQESVLALAEREADSIALMSDIAAEHVYLFGQPLRNARALRAEAIQRKLSLEAVWQEKYGVVKARSDKEAAEKKAAEDLIRKNERELVTAEFASKYGNPETRPLAPSTNFLTPRPTTGRDKQPWEAGFDGESGSNDRVRRVTESALRRQNVN